MENNKELHQTTKKKFTLSLPDNFNEILLSWEIKFENGNMSLETIRNIIYLYSVTFLLRWLWNIMILLIIQNIIYTI